MTDKKQHSVPVPQLYKEASRILKRYDNREGGLKTLVYSGRYRNYGKIYGLLCKTVQNTATIKTALALANLFIEQPSFDQYLAQVLTADLLTKGMLQGDCKPMVILRKYEEKIKETAGPNFDKQSTHCEKKDCSPRYVRVNTLLSSMDRVQAQLASEGWRFQEYNPLQVTYDGFLNLIQNIDESTYLKDYHIPELLVFPPNTTFWDNILYKKNAIILQDKSSCLPVFLSSIKSGAKVIDACAAPGNKTSYIAGRMNNTGKVLATEKNAGRHKTLLRLLAQRGATCVTSRNEDFSRLPQDSDVEYIFLDPTCSSSGVNIHKDEVSQQRIRSLALFQVRLLLYALSFPSVKEVMYSTCSVNVEENEEVVEEALSQYHDQFELEDLGQKLPGWKHFEDMNFSFGKRCLRTNTEIDKCHGFFIAKFVRKATKEYDGLHSDKWEGQKRKHSSCSNPSNNEEVGQCLNYNSEIGFTGQSIEPFHRDSVQDMNLSLEGSEDPNTELSNHVICTHRMKKRKKSNIKGNSINGKTTKEVITKTSDEKQKSKCSIKHRKGNDHHNVESNEMFPSSFKTKKGKNSKQKKRIGMCHEYNNETRYKEWCLELNVKKPKSDDVTCLSEGIEDAYVEYKDVIPPTQKKKRKKSRKKELEMS